MMTAPQRMKGLVIAEPWISLILNGEKTWEMRARITTHRGPIALVRKGSGSVVGIADLVDCKAILGEAEYRKNEHLHRVPRVDQVRAAVRWPIAWVLKNARALDPPIRYKHKTGAQSQIILSKSESDAVRELCVRLRSPVVREVRVTQSCLDNSYVPLTAVMDLFPDQAIGGPNMTESAPDKIIVTFAGGTWVSTDLDGSKKMLRSRGAVKAFYSAAKAKVGDLVIIRRMGERTFSFDIRSS
jgi:hypothetical protein